MSPRAGARARAAPLAAGDRRVAGFGRIVAIGVTVWTLGQPILAQPSELESVRAEALHTYYHGITAELARERIGAAGVPALLRLLAEPTFPRRDNVVAFLGFLGGVETTDGLLRFLAAPPAPIDAPEEDRALLLAPQSLGHLASRGEPRALDALLRMTAGGQGGGALGAAAARAARPAALRDDLLEQALLGLAYARSPRAAARLRAIESGAVRPAARGRDLRPAAREALDRLEALGAGAPAATDGDGRRSDRDPAGLLDGDSSGSGAGSGVVARDFDGAHADVRQSLLTYANHPAVTNPMTDARLDAILANVSVYLGRADFGEDVGCCAGLARSGTALTFGSLNDGLDTIDNNAELNSVLNNAVSRVKVVRIISHCGGPGTNIIGCAWVGGEGMALVRFSLGNETFEGQLWAHEYGHNVGLSHHSDNRYVMYFCLCWTSYGLTQSECNRFHTPVGGADAIQVDLGACTDVDWDAVQDQIDNCPGAPNNPQTDANVDGIGDVCEDGCGNDILDAGEECDVSHLDGETCVSQGYPGGTLRCALDCTFDESDCIGGPTKTPTPTSTRTNTPTNTPTPSRTPTGAERRRRPERRRRAAPPR